MVSLAERFMSKVAFTDTCWLWMGAYGMTARGMERGHIHLDGRHIIASRVAWMLRYGEIPERMNVLHRCDVSLCVNPAHLFLGTQTDNMRDAAAKGRIVSRNGERTHCVNGHPFEGGNLILRKTGGRRCRECKNIRQRKGYGLAAQPLETK